MANDVSRLWTLSDNPLLTHFDSQYPQAVLTSTNAVFFDFPLT